MVARSRTIKKRVLTIFLRVGAQVVDSPRNASVRSTFGAHPSTPLARLMSRLERFSSPSRVAAELRLVKLPAAASAITECNCRTEVSTPVPILKRWPPPASPEGLDERVDHIADEHIVAGVGAVAEDLGRPARRAAHARRSPPRRPRRAGPGAGL